MRRIILLFVAFLLGAAVASAWWFTRPLPVLTVTTWAGAYGRAQAAALMRPYATRKRVDVHLAEWDGDLSDLENSVARHAYNGDVIDFELPTAVAACHRGLLEKVDAGTLPPGTDGIPAAKDFVPGAVGPCWVGSVVYSQMIIYAPNRFGDAPPRRMADFFDLVKFPGKRALRRGSAKFNLEMALLADGIAPADVYKTLDSDAGLNRAFAKLDSIRTATIWADTAAQILDLVESGQAAFGTTLNGDVYDAARRGFTPGLIWDRQLYELDVFGIPAGDPKKDRAMDFVRFATGTAPLAGVADWVPLGPARRSSLALVGSNPELHTAMRNWLPTAAANFATAFPIDDEWWRIHGPQVEVRWRRWLAAH